MTDTERGLHRKFRVYEDGEEIPDCFVLEPESDPAAREALLRYAKATGNEKLAEDLREWVADLQTRRDQDV